MAVSAHSTTAKIMVLGVLIPYGRRCPPMFSNLGWEWGLRCTKRSCSTILFFCWLKASHPQEQECVDQAPCQVMQGEKGMAIPQDKFYGYLASRLLPPSSQDLNPPDMAGYGVLERCAIKTSHLNSCLSVLRLPFAKEGLFFQVTFSFKPGNVSASV